MTRSGFVSTKLLLFGARRQRLIDKTMARLSPVGVADLIARADAMRDSGNLEAAADAYRAALRAAPDQVTLLALIGNCLKDAGEYSGSLRAYSELIETQDGGDVELQLGHLLKVTGHFRLALQAYQRSRALGDGRSDAEISGAADWCGETALVGPAAVVSGRDEVPLGAFQSVLACDRAAVLDHATFQAAGTYLARHNSAELGRAYCEFAAICGGTSRFKSHIDFVLRSGLWAFTEISELSSAQLERTAVSRVRSPTLLRQLVETALTATDQAQASIEVAAPHVSGETRWPPGEITAAQLLPLSARIPRLVRALFEAAWFTSSGVGKAYLDATKSLSQATRGLAGMVFFPTDRSEQQFALCATHVLASAVSRWLATGASRYTSSFVTPTVLGEFLRAGQNPLRDRLDRRRSYASIFHEIDQSIYAAAPDLETRRADIAMAQVFAVCLPDLRPEEINGFLDVALGHGIRTAAVLLEASAIGKSQTESDLVSLAQKLKSLGDLGLAFEVIERIDEETASTSTLIEKALIAKAVGNFAHSARLLEGCALRDPTNEFLRRELVMVLPEVESLTSIIDRYRCDEIFMTAARKRACYRIALQEEHEIKIDAPVSETLRVSDLSPELAIELRRHPKRQAVDREETRILGAGSSWRSGLEANYRVLRRIDFVRAQSATKIPIARLRVRIDGKTLAETEGAELSRGFEGSMLKHKVYNCWLDLSNITTGFHELQLYFEETEAGWRAINELVWVEAQEVADKMLENSMAFVPLPSLQSEASVQERIAALPSLVLPAARTLFAAPVEKMLIVRADQLGDTSQSIGAMAALKEAFPRAHVDALTSVGNRDLLTATGLFDEVHTVDLTYDLFERRRYASIAEQVRLHVLLTPKRYDLAIDLSPGFETQNLLKLVGARYTAGFKPNEFRWLTFGMDVQTHDPVNRLEMVSHSAQISAFAAALISMATHKPYTNRNSHAESKLLETFGIKPKQKYAVLHSGARLEIKRWPLARYVELARLLTEKAGLKTVLLADDASMLSELDTSTFPAGLLHASAQKLPFQIFDSLLSLCSVFVGNDTGPKHFAALRGARVVSVHMGQVNWNEWGQDGDGLIVARRAPCVGCGIEMPEECGMGLACLEDIRAEEVFDAVMQLINPTTTETLATEGTE